MYSALVHTLWLLHGRTALIPVDSSLLMNKELLFMLPGTVIALILPQSSPCGIGQRTSWIETVAVLGLPVI